MNKLETERDTVDTFSEGEKNNLKVLRKFFLHFQILVLKENGKKHGVWKCEQQKIVKGKEIPILVMYRQSLVKLNLVNLQATSNKKLSRKDNSYECHIAKRLRLVALRKT